VSFLIFNDLFNITKDWYLLVVFEKENTSLPNLLDSVEFLLDLIFLLGSIDKLSYLLSKSKELKLNKVLEAKLWALEFDVFLSKLHKFFPMSIHHEFGVKL